MCAGPSEPCYYEPLCFTPWIDTLGGLGCSAGGKQGCRFCNFGPFPDCPTNPPSTPPPSPLPPATPPPLMTVVESKLNLDFDGSVALNVSSIAALQGKVQLGLAAALGCQAPRCTLAFKSANPFASLSAVTQNPVTLSLEITTTILDGDTQPLPPPQLLSPSPPPSSVTLQIETSTELNLPSNDNTTEFQETLDNMIFDLIARIQAHARQAATRRKLNDADATANVHIRAVLSLAIPLSMLGALQDSLPSTTEESSTGQIFWTTSPSTTCISFNIHMQMAVGESFGPGHALYDVAFDYIPMIPSALGRSNETLAAILLQDCTDVPVHELATLIVTATSESLTSCAPDDAACVEDFQSSLPDSVRSSVSSPPPTPPPAPPPAAASVATVNQEISSWMGRNGSQLAQLIDVPEISGASVPEQPASVLKLISPSPPPPSTPPPPPFPPEPPVAP